MESQSANFSAKELRCKCGVCAQQQPNWIKQPVLDALQRVRERYGKGMVLTSAYRCAQHPVEAKKAAPGQHNKGVAFDVAVPWGRDRMRLVQIALEEGFSGFGFAKTFLHLDFRDGPLTSWTYS